MVHHRIPIADGGMAELSNAVVLCRSCHRDSPHDLFLFENLYLRFSSPKEMILHYGAKTEEEAFEKWQAETGYKGAFDYRSHGDLIKEKMAHKVRNGGLPGFGHPFGYDIKDGKLLLNAEESKVVREIFDMYTSGRSLKKIVRYLNYKGIPPKRGKKWYPTTISKILKNPLYCGYISWDGVIKKAQHEEIIDVGIFNEVQKMLSKRSNKPPLILG
ncbi:MAG: hypothetical protein GXP49_08705 [Deltaproteobacteria bacterium]|nr:hypothetical protein [Deltaproteobacteria bacterium]